MTSFAKLNGSTATADLLALAAVSLTRRRAAALDTERQAWLALPLTLRCLISGGGGVWLGMHHADLIQTGLRGALAGQSEDDVLDACCAFLEHDAHVGGKRTQADDLAIMLLNGETACEHDDDPDHQHLPPSWAYGYCWRIQVERALGQAQVVVEYV